MVYIDFDGVILDTEKLLFEEWRKMPNHSLLSEEKKIQYIQVADWKHILDDSEIIRDSLYYLKEMDPKKSTILTKIHSLTNEGMAKVHWIRKNNIEQPIVLVPYTVSKSNMVPASGNILIDDCLKNLNEWSSCGGIPILFDINNDDYDSWGMPNVKGYQKVKDLSVIKKRD